MSLLSGETLALHLNRLRDWIGARRRVLLEAGALLGVFVAVYAYLVQIQAFEAFYEFSRAHEDIQLDHLVMSVIPACIVLIILVVRRIHDTSRANEDTKAALLRLEALYAQQEQLRRAADDANQAKSTFLANMSHELRTPLNAIIGYTEMVIEDLGAEPQHAAPVEDLSRVIGSANHLLSLINDVLDLAKIEAGRVDMRISTFDPAEIVAEIVALGGTLADKTGTRLKLTATESLGEIHSDPGKLRQCLLNLVSNACKFTQGGVVEISLARGAGDVLKFTVRDSGIGMSAGEMARLFQPFQQADASIANRFGGTGLGLSITRRLARMLGGDVWFESVPNEGTTAFLTIAVDARNILGEGDEVDPRIGPIGAPLVLVIEDRRDARDLVARGVAPAGFAVQGVATGRMALQLAPELRPALILLDIFLPDMSGWAVLEQLRDNPATRDIPTIVLSVSDDRERSLALGAAEHLVKPARRDQLAATAMRLARAPAPIGADPRDSDAVQVA